jgi:hypothetical protein
MWHSAFELWTFTSIGGFDGADVVAGDSRVRGFAVGRSASSSSLHQAVTPGFRYSLGDRLNI